MSAAPEQIVIRVGDEHYLVVAIQVKGIQVCGGDVGEIYIWVKQVKTFCQEKDGNGKYKKKQLPFPVVLQMEQKPVKTGNVILVCFEGTGGC